MAKDKSEATGGYDPADTAKASPPASVGKAGDITTAGDPDKPWPHGTAHPGVQHVDAAAGSTPATQSDGIAGADSLKGAAQGAGQAALSGRGVVSEEERVAAEKQAIADHLQNAQPDFASVSDNPNPPQPPEGGTKYAPPSEAEPKPAEPYKG